MVEVVEGVAAAGAAAEVEGGAAAEEGEVGVVAAAAEPKDAKFLICTLSIRCTLFLSTKPHGLY